MVNIGIIGYGFMGQKHAKEIKKFKDFNLLGIYDIRNWKNDLAKENGINTYSSYAEMLADPKLEIVLIALPNHLHMEYSIEAMKKGKHVFCEKPVALNLKELKKMYMASEKYNKFLFIHQNRRFDNDFLTIKSILLNTEFNIRQLDSFVVGGRGIPDGWRRERKFGGGMLYDWGVHLLDQINCIIEETNENIKSLYCKFSHTQAFDVDDGVKIILTSSTGKIFNINIDTNTFIDTPRWIAYDENSTTIIKNWDLAGYIATRLNTDFDNSSNILGNGFSKTMTKLSDRSIKHSPLPDNVCGDEMAFYKNICECINGTSTPLVTKQQSIEIMKLIDACFLSDKLDKIIKF